MRKSFYLLLLVLVCACTSNEPEAEYEQQKISSRADCITCNGWTWSNGIATIGRSGDGGTFYYTQRSFSFLTKIAGELTLEFKMNDSDYLCWVLPWVDEEHGNHQYTTSKNFEKVSLGHIDENKIVYICGTNVIIRNVMVTGDLKRNDNPDNPQWDF